VRITIPFSYHRVFVCSSDANGRQFGVNFLGRHVRAGGARSSFRPETHATARMQILSLDMLKAGMELPRVGQAISLGAPLTALAWGTTGISIGKSKACHPRLRLRVSLIVTRLPDACLSLLAWTRRMSCIVRLCGVIRL
jgi:hypothetical protein